MRRGVLAFGAVSLGVLALYAWALGPNVGPSAGQGSAGAYYNLQVAGFRSGQLSLKREAPAGLAALPDPYDPRASERFRVGLQSVHDLSYYQGRLYLYFGVTPALLLFWPWTALTGGHLSHAQAVWAGCAAGFLAAAGLIGAWWRRYFAETPAWIAAAALLAFGLADSVLILLQRPEVYEVAIAWGHALVLLSLAALWAALHQPGRRLAWGAAASLAYGLAVGARPPLLFGAPVLLLPLAAEWAERPAPARMLRVLAAAAVPLVLCGLGLAWYNQARFQDPFEFGQHYQLAASRQDTAQHFSLRYLGFNLRMYFLEPPRIGGSFPFLRPVLWPKAPPGHDPGEDSFGILPNVPFVLLALAAPLAWLGRPKPEGRRLRLFAAAIALVFGANAALFGLFYGVTTRYEFEFLPALLLLAALGIFGLERRLAARPPWRRAARGGWACLLGVSVVLGGLGADLRGAHSRLLVGSILADGGLPEKGIALMRAALRLAPDLPATHNNLANAYLRLGRLSQAEAEYARAVQLDPAEVGSRYNLANLLVREGRAADAVIVYQEALQLKPAYAEAHYNLAIALHQLGRDAEANAQLQEAVRLRPDMDPRRRHAAYTP